MTSFRKLIVPLSLLIIAVILRPKMIELYSEYGQLFEWLPYLSLGSALLLAAVFNVSRLFALTIAMLFTYIIIQLKLQSALDDPASLFIYTSLSFSFSALTFILLFVPERGLKNKYGILVCSLVPVVLILNVLIFLLVPEQTISSFIILNFTIKPIDGYILSIVASLMYLIVFITAIIQLYKSNDEYIAISLALLIFNFITLAFFGHDKISTIVSTAAGLALIVTLLRSSYNMAYSDDLTGLLGRRALNDRIKGLSKPYVIAMSDVDHFKKFNDTYGHDIGDDVLKLVAKQLESVQGGGIAYRYGGEEFCIIFPGKLLDECEPFLEVVRKSVENYKMTVRNPAYRPNSDDKAIERRGRRSKNREENFVSVTISIGAAECNSKDTVPEEVLKAADNALYKAKNKGRNCLVMAHG